MKVLNWGINGDTTGGMLARFQAHSAVKDARAAISYGRVQRSCSGRGYGRGKSQYVRPGAAMLQFASAVLGIPIPVRYPITFHVSMDVERACAAYDGLRPWLHSLAEDFPCLWWIFIVGLKSFWSLRPSTAGSILTPCTHADGLHASEAGHALAAQTARALHNI